MKKIIFSLILLQFILFSGFASASIKLPNISQNYIGFTLISGNVSASADDARERPDDSYFSSGTTDLETNSSTTPASRQHVGTRIPVTIPVGATIISANASIYVYGSNDDQHCEIFGEDVESPQNYSDNQTIFARVRTTANVTWDNEELPNGARAISPDLKTIIQELVDSYNYSEGGYINLVWISRISSEQDCSWYSYDYDGGSLPTILNITYEADGVEAPTVTIENPSNIGEYYCTTQGSVTDNGSANVTESGFEWDTDSGAPYANSDDADGGIYYPEFEIEVLSSLEEGTAYYIRAYSTNADNETGYSEEKSFITLPYSVDSFASPSKGETWISFTWANGDVGISHQSIRYQEGSYPADNVSGTQGFYGADSSANITGLDDNTTYYFRLFSIAIDDGLSSQANATDDLTITTDEGAAIVLQPPTNFTIVDLGGITARSSWTTAENATYTMVRMSRESYPSSVTSGELIYYDSENVTNIVGLALDSVLTVYYFSAWSFESDNSTFSSSYSIATIGGDMLVSHLFVLIPLLVLLILSLVYYGKGLVHLLTGSYALVIGYMAVVNEWEILFFPIVVFSVIIALILFAFAMLKGDWL